MSVKPARATRQLTVAHKAGLHARPSLAIVKTVKQFQSHVEISNGHHKADAGDILQILSMGVPEGSQITLAAQGPDAEQVLDALVKLFAEDFGM